MTRTRILVLVAALALAVVATGSATAAKLITGGDIKNNSITGKDVKKGSLAANDLSAKARNSLKGAQGPAGPAVLPSAYAAADDSVNLAADDEATIISKNVPAGTYVVNAKLVLFQNAADNGGCSLNSGATAIDTVAVIPADTNARTPMAFQGIATLPAAGTLSISCLVDAQAGVAQEVKLTAIAVSQVS
jgi:hypothetical protein